MVGHPAALEALEVQSLAWDAVEARPAYGLDGDRHKGGVSLARALAWNVGTWDTVPREKVQGDAPRGRKYRSVAQGRINP